MKLTVKAISSETEGLTSTLHLMKKRRNLTWDLEGYYDAYKQEGFSDAQLITFARDTCTLNFVSNLLGERHENFSTLTKQILKNKHLGNSLARSKN